MKIKLTADNWIIFQCPGCNAPHGIPVDGSRGWQWNGSLDKPTVTPSILVNVSGGNPTVPICHSFIIEGQIQFLNDCTHKLAGKTVDLPEAS
jgi:hypothetical protein